MSGLIGRDHNNPPEVIELASGVVSDIGLWMADNPVIETEEDAKGIKLQIDRAKLCIKDLEAERDGKTRPLLDALESARAPYRGPRRMLGDLLDEMLARLQAFVKAEERRREAIAVAAAAKAAEAALLARAAELEEQEKLNDASHGEVGVNVAEVIAKADQAFEEYEKSEREAIRAEKDIHVKVGGGFSRSIGLRKVETLHVEDATAAIGEMGVTGDIAVAILKSARAFNRLNGRLPKGIISKVETKL